MKEQLDFQASEVGINDLKLKGFKVYEVNDTISKIPTYNRRDFYKICINTSQS
jgi:AraC family transcriptional activator of pobA